MKYEIKDTKVTLALFIHVPILSDLVKSRLLELRDLE